MRRRRQTPPTPLAPTLLPSSRAAVDAAAHRVRGAATGASDDHRADGRGKAAWAASDAAAYAAYEAVGDVAAAVTYATSAACAANAVNACAAVADVADAACADASAAVARRHCGLPRERRCSKSERREAAEVRRWQEAGRDASRSDAEGRRTSRGCTRSELRESGARRPRAVESGRQQRLAPNKQRGLVFGVPETRTERWSARRLARTQRPSR